jgi:EpsD family peptidyl-prolyl cis-trans isomerase
MRDFRLGGSRHTQLHMTSCNNQTLAIALAAALLASCGKDDSGSATRVAVKVNAEEITMHELSSEQARLRLLNGPQSGIPTAQLLDQLVDRTLLVQRAIARELDRDPRVLHAIEASRRQILAQAYLDSITARAARPLPADVVKFYALHPELFAERKIYRLQELAIAPRPDLTTARIEGELREAKSLNEIIDWLKREQITFDANSTVKAAEQLPMEVVPRLTALKQGQALLVPAQQGYLVVQMAAAELQPLSEEQARPFIEQYLTNQRRRELVQEEVRVLRREAHIEYVGEFASDAGAVSSAAAPAVPPAAPAAVTTPSAGNSLTGPLTGRGMKGI